MPLFLVVDSDVVEDVLQIQQDGRDDEASLDTLLANLRALRAEVARLRNEQADDGPRLIDVETAANRLSVSERTLRSYLSDGTILSVKIGRRRLIRAKDLEKFVEDHLDGGPSGE